jgi:hypothetical protein
MLLIWRKNLDQMSSLWNVKKTTVITHIYCGDVVAVIAWWLDLQLPMQSVPITTDVVSSNLDQGEVYNIMW